MARVLTSSEAKQAIQQMQSIINGGLTDQISQLDTQGQTLSDANVWDGPLAQQFRGDVWPQTKSALDKAKQELEDLRNQLDQISTNIFTAGGGELAPHHHQSDLRAIRAVHRICVSPTRRTARILRFLVFHFFSMTSSSPALSRLATTAHRHVPREALTLSARNTACPARMSTHNDR